MYDQSTVVKVVLETKNNLDKTFEAGGLLLSSQHS